jgi:hypothetical protein
MIIFHTRTLFFCFIVLRDFGASESEAKALLTIAGDERVNREDLVARGILVGG